MGAAPAAATRNEPLAKISRELEECSLRVEQIVTRAGDSLWTPNPRGGWAVGQCIAHLTRTAQEWAPRIERGLANAPAGSPPYRPTLTGRLLAWFLEPPYRIKAKTVPIFTPRDRKLAATDLLAEFLDAQQEVERMLRLADGKAIDRIILSSPVSAKMKYDIYSALRILAAHERRHLWQAGRILARLRAQ